MVRLYVVFHTYVITNDGVLYVELAKLLSRGEVGKALSVWAPNLYPVIIALFQRVFDDWEFSGQLVSTFFGTLTIVPFYLLMRSLFGRPVALIASLLFTCHPYLVRFSAEVIRGPTFWFFFMMTLWVGWEGISRRMGWLLALTGFFGAVSFLLRPEGIFVIPVLAFWVCAMNWRSSTVQQKIVLPLIVLIAVPVVLSPGMLYFRIRTGDWNWARADLIPGIALGDVKMKSIKENWDRIEINRWGDCGEANLEWIRLKAFLSLAKDHRLSIIGVEILAKFMKGMHLLVLLLFLFGVFGRRKIEYRKKKELFLASVAAVFVLVLVRYGSIYVCISTRHVIIPVILCLGWAGAGVVEIENRFKHFLLKKGGAGTKIAQFSWFRWALLLLILLALLPMTLASQRLDKISMREAGAWIKENGPSTPVILGDAGLARVGFYAEGRFLEIPVGEDLFEYARAQGVDFLVVNDRSIGPSHPDLVDLLDSRHFREKVVIGDFSESHVIRIYGFEL